MMTNKNPKNFHIKPLDFLQSEQVYLQWLCYILTSWLRDKDILEVS